MRYKAISQILIIFLTVTCVFPGWPKIFNSSIVPAIEVAQAANFSMKTGYYVGSGATTTISGLGFQPSLVIVKSDQAGSKGGMFYTSSMPANNGAYLSSATANSVLAFEGMTSDGFTVGTDTDTNASGVIFQYTAFSGTGTNFQVGSYSGDATDDRLIDTVGFQPDLVIVKGDTASTSVWRSSAMPTGVSMYFSATASSTNMIQGLGAAGFQIGTDATVNTAGVTFYYVAFKSTAGSMAVGSYTGNASDGRSITGVGFQANWVFVKNGGGAYAAAHRSDQLSGDASSNFTNVAIAVDLIQALESDGFQVGTNNQVNRNTNAYYYAAFGGASARSASGAFSMKTGYYVGTGSAMSITGVGFQPDFVMIRSSASALPVFRTSIMSGDSASLFGATAEGTSRITSLDSDGFSVGIYSGVNSANVIFQYVAFDGVDNTNFKVGAYTGTGGDDRTITGVGFQPDFVMVKSATAQSGVWRTSATTTDRGEYFIATNGAANLIQSLASDGFQVGTAAQVNTAAITYYYVAFKETANTMAVGSYAGDGNDDRSITDVGFQPNWVFVKLDAATAAVSGVARADREQGDSSALFSTGAIAQNKIQGFVSNGFQVGSDSSVNVSTTGNTYFYAAFGGATADATPSGNYYMKTGSYTGTGAILSVSSLGFTPDLVFVKSTAATMLFYKSSPMKSTLSMGLGVAGTATNAITSLDSDGFTVGANANINTASRTYVWYAFGNSGSASFKVGAYAANGAQDSRSITGVGFQPDFVNVSTDTGGLGVWRTSDLPGDDTFKYNNVATSTDLIQSLQSDGFQVGTTSNVAGTSAGDTLFYFAFKQVSNYMDVGTYTGDGLDDRNITSPGFQPDVVWLKNVGANAAVNRSTNVSAGNAQYFTATADGADLIQGFGVSGFQIGADAKVNSNGIAHYYAAWKIIPADLQQIHFRWRNDDGDQSAATFAAAEDTAISSVVKSTTKRLRLEISNEGSAASTTSFGLQYGTQETTCAAISSWTTVPVSATTEHWQMSASDNITAGESTTNVSSGLTDANPTFVAGNILDASATTDNIALTTVDFTEIEYSIQATDNATNGAIYCFRTVSNGLATNFSYQSYPTATLAAPAVAISLSTDGVVSFGDVGVNTTVSTTAATQETVSVDTGPANLTIQSTNFTTSSFTWTLGDANGSNIVEFEFATSTNPTWVTFSNSSTAYILDSGVAQGGTRDIRFQLTMPTITDSYSQYASAVTITASAP